MANRPENVEFSAKRNGNMIIFALLGVLPYRPLIDLKFCTVEWSFFWC